jgi:hypothetical protein
MSAQESFIEQQMSRDQILGLRGIGADRSVALFMNVDMIVFHLAFGLRPRQVLAFEWDITAVGLGSGWYLGLEAG